MWFIAIRRLKNSIPVAVRKNKYEMSRKRITFLLFGIIIPLLMGLHGCKPEPKLPAPPYKPPLIRLLTERTLKSQLLNRDIKYAVLLPKEYDSLNSTYPVVYLLHGFGDDETAWYTWGDLQNYVDADDDGKIPMIYVMPQGFNSYWVNQYDGAFPYMNMLVKEMVPQIDLLYHTIKDPQHRAVMGYSMGGYGALITTAKNPSVFKTGVVLSMSYRTDQQYMAESQSGWDVQWGSIFGGIGTRGAARLTDYYKENNPFYFFTNPNDISLKGQNYYFDCGDDEENLSRPNDSLHGMLRNLNIKHEYRVRNGAHSWDYWHSALPEALRYISSAVQNISYPADPVPVNPGAIVPAERIFTEQVEGTNIEFSVTVPLTYLTEAKNYPVILALHDRNIATQDEESQKIKSLINTMIGESKIPASLLVEIPLQTGTVSAAILQQIITQVRSKYRTIADRNHTLLLGNKQAGLLAYQLVTTCSQQINTCLLFDANIPLDASADNSDVSYYLDITDEGINYDGYHSLYMSVRKNQLNHEYRVRQGTPSHESFLNGLYESAAYIYDHLNN
jgi:enterochelin esterase-like enzyme